LDYTAFLQAHNVTGNSKVTVTLGESKEFGQFEANAVEKVKFDVSSVLLSGTGFKGSLGHSTLPREGR
jgi:hypothetical protein